MHTIPSVDRLCDLGLDLEFVRTAAPTKYRSIRDMLERESRCFGKFERTLRFNNGPNTHSSEVRLACDGSWNLA